jgi:hypothetical protein
MATGPRQERIGNMPVAGEQNSAQPGPDATRDITSVKRQAENAANRRKEETAGFIQSPQGSGAGGHELGGAGDMYVWDSGLAISDVEGGGSG